MKLLFKAVKLVKVNGRPIFSIWRKFYCHQGNNQCNKYTNRSHSCGDLNLSDVGSRVTICGWLQFQRLKKFAILRDAYGLTQIILPEERADMMNLLEDTPLESVVQVKGEVVARPADQINNKMPTGEVEVIADEFTILNKINRKLPFSIRDFQKANESLRMEYRYLDLRFSEMQRNLRLRSQILLKMRKFLADEVGFVEIETPTLFKRTPGGAQEFIVPTQTPGCFYSLVQSPQQLKQLLMVGGIDRYFQFARCYRDETARPDRQPEFTQLDIELSFTDSECVISLVEDLLKNSLCPEMNIETPFKRISYHESMESYGTDQPDLTIIPKIEKLDMDLPDGLEARYLNVPKVAGLVSSSMKESFLKLKRTHFKNLLFNVLKNPGSDWDKFSARLDGWTGSGNDLKKMCCAKESDCVFICIGPKAPVLMFLGKIRTMLANSLRSLGVSGEWEDPSRYSFVWVLDFPLFELNDDGNLKAAHHPFTSPHPEDVHLLQTNPLKVRGVHYDLVMNGWEIGGGSMRIHDPHMQRYVLKDLLNIQTEDLEHLLAGLGSGAPPHGGIALGIDRLLSIIVGAKSIRDVIAFPKSSDGKDLMTGAPCPVKKEELELYNVDVLLKKLLSNLN